MNESSRSIPPMGLHSGSSASRRRSAATPTPRGIHWERLLPLLAPGTEEHEAVRTALDTL